MFSKTIARDARAAIELSMHRPNHSIDAISAVVVPLGGRNGLTNKFVLPIHANAYSQIT